MSDIYLDNAATTPLSSTALEAMLPYLREDYGNASAKYYEKGKRCRRALCKARQQIAALINAEPPLDEDKPSEIVFTSGATESNNWVLKSAADATKKRHYITSSFEHHAVLETCEHLAKIGQIELTVLPVDSTGLVDPADLKQALRSDTGLVSIMLANNEVGTLQPVRELAEIAHAGGALFHTDAVQAVGKIPVDVKELGVDFLSLSSHKFYGPKGIGALFIRKGLRLEPLMHGGGQEHHKRAGTYNVAGIVGMGAAAQEAQETLVAEAERQRGLVERLWQGLSAATPKITRNGHPDKRLPGILNVRFQGAEGEAVLLRLDMFGIQVASGSACSTDSLEPSHVLLALGIVQEDAHGSIRLSLGKQTTAEDIEKVIKIMPDQIRLIREMSVTWNG